MLAYSLTNYGGIRSPDGEILFRVGRSLAESRGFVIDSDLKAWPGWGLVPGKDGSFYSAYPPFQSMLLAPFIKLGEAMNRTGWYKNTGIPVSYYVDSEPILKIADGEVIQTWSPPLIHKSEHALRFFVSWLFPILSSISVMIFWTMLRMISGSTGSAWATSVLYAFGSLAWPYSGTCFTEPLTTLLILVALYMLVLVDPSVSQNSVKKRFLFFSGLSLGLATATHPAGILFAPFFLLYATFSLMKTRLLRQVIFLVAGLIIVLSLLGLFNYFRFGNFLDFGRQFDKILHTVFNPPTKRAFWHGLFGLLFSPGKGLIFFSPGVFLGAITWPALHRRYPALSLTLAGSILARLFLFSSYFQWDGGFALGPRYLVPLLPLILIPFAVWFAEFLRRQKTHVMLPLAIALWFCIAQQIFFCIGDIFSYYVWVKDIYQKHGLNAFAGDFIYISWRASPLYQLIHFRRGPFLLQSIPVSNEFLWLAGCILSAAIVIAGYRFLRSAKQT